MMTVTHRYTHRYQSRIRPQKYGPDDPVLNTISDADKIMGVWDTIDKCWVVYDEKTRTMDSRRKRVILHRWRRSALALVLTTDNRQCAAVAA